MAKLRRIPSSPVTCKHDNVLFGRYRRRLTVKEAGRLQSFPMDTFVPDANRQQAYKQFGNSVNVEVIKRAAVALFGAS